MIRELIQIRVRGQVVGRIRGVVFEKTIRGSRHLLHHPPAICISEDALAQAERAGAYRMEICDGEASCLYSITIAEFRRFGFRVERGGFDRQLGCRLDHFLANGTTALRPRSASTNQSIPWKPEPGRHERSPRIEADPAREMPCPVQLTLFDSTYRGPPFIKKEREREGERERVSGSERA